MLRGLTVRRLLSLLAAVVAAGLAAGCGGSAPKGPPDLLFVSTRDGDYALFGADAKGHHVWRLSKQKGDPSTPAGLFFQVDPAWSPNGRLIAFVSLRDGTDHIYLMNADGTGTRRLTATREEDVHPSWSPDGKRLVFSRGGALFVVPAGGGAAKRIGHAPGEASDPAWSPNGKLIAYSYRRPSYRSHEIWTVHADGTHPRQLTDFGEVSGGPAWSPDGKTIAFHSNFRYGHLEIYTIHADGKGLREWTTSIVDAFDPAWSPDGQSIAFSRDAELVEVNAAGKEQQLTSGHRNDLAPAWRPLQRH